MQNVSILFISFNSGWHEDVWNVLAIESLVGDLSGYYGDKVKIDTIRIRDFDSLEETFSIIKKKKYQLVGLSLDIGSQLFFLPFLQGFIRYKLNNLLVCGGTLVTYANDFLLERKEIQMLRPILIMGEGEIAWREIVDRYITGKDYFNIDNTWVYCPNRQIYVQAENKVVDLNKLIYAPAHINYFGEYHPVHILQASRNCISHCSYCSQGPNRIWRSFKLERIETNLRDLINLGIYEFEFVDDEFFGGMTKLYLDRAWEIARIFQKLEREFNVVLKFRVFTNPFIICSKFKDSFGRNIYDLLKFMKSVGLSRVYLGVESGSIEQRKRYARIESLEQCEHAIQILDKIGIVVDAGFIMFDPEVTFDDLRDNIKFIKKNNFIKYNTWPLRPLILTNNTPIYYRTKKLGLVKNRSNDNPASYTYDFLYKEVGILYNAVSTVADQTSKVFYILKYFYKSYCYSAENIKLVSLVYDLLMENAKINLEYLDDMLIEYENSAKIIYSTEKVRKKLYKLISQVEDICPQIEKLNYSVSYLNKSIKESKKILLD